MTNTRQEDLLLYNQWLQMFDEDNAQTEDDLREDPQEPGEYPAAGEEQELEDDDLEDSFSQEYRLYLN